MIREFNAAILRHSLGISYRVDDEAPSTERDLFTPRHGLVVWSGASDRTIFGDPRVNWAFRALHDATHLASGLGFSVDHEIELGRRQAAKFDGIMADLVYLEIAGQAEYFRRTGSFVPDQVEFTRRALASMGVSVSL